MEVTHLANRAAISFVKMILMYLVVSAATGSLYARNTRKKPCEHSFVSPLIYLNVTRCTDSFYLIVQVVKMRWTIAVPETQFTLRTAIVTFTSMHQMQDTKAN